MAPASLQGQTLGKYRVLEPLGRGGMAQVYRAYHPGLDRYVAVKVLRSDLVEEGEFLARFRREARAVATLRHPHIVQVYDFDAQDGLYYMVMELLEGDTLKARLNDYHLRGEGMPAGEMVRILLDVLEGLAYAHGEGVVHRDIKPANIMLTRDGQAVLTDFGIAQIVGGTRQTAAGVLMGTLNYISPEQGLEGHSDPRSDIYSLGIVFYEMLVGRPPFDADTPLAILMKHLHDPLPLPRELDSSIPEPFERIVLKALAKQPEERFQTVAEMAQALHQASEEIGLGLPERISLPLSFTTPEAPAEAVNVLSGTARERVTDAGFASEDTDVSAVHAPAAAPVGRAERVRQAWLRGSAELERFQGKHGVGKAVLAGLGLVAAGNLLAVTVGGMLNDWSLFSRGWPAQMLWVGAGLALVMYAAAARWLFLPTALVLGNGVLMSYYSLTSWWRQWSFLWPLEPLLLAVAIVVTVRLARQGDEGRQAARRMGGYLAQIGLLWSIVVVVVAIVLP